MNIVLQIAVVALCILFFVCVFKMVSSEKLLLKYSLLWLALTIVILFCAFYPEPIYFFSSLLGFETPSNFIFLLGLFFLLAVTLSHSAITSKQALRIKNLTQQLALLEKEISNQSKKD